MQSNLHAVAVEFLFISRKREKLDDCFPIRGLPQKSEILRPRISFWRFLEQLLRWRSNSIQAAIVSRNRKPWNVETLRVEYATRPCGRGDGRAS